MTLRSVLAIAVLLPACLDSGGYESPDPPVFPPSNPPPGHPPDPSNDPFEFDVEQVAPGVGLDVVLRVNVPLGGYELTSTDPEVADIEILDGVIHLRTLAPGSAAIEARRRDDLRLIDRVLVDADTVDRVDLMVRASAVSPAPLAAMAALPHGADTVGIVYRSPTGAPLDGLGTIAATGAVSIGPSEELLSEIFERRLPVGLSFGAPGAGTLELGMGAAGTRSVPIDVLETTAATTLELVPLVLRNGMVVVAPDPLDAGEIMGVDLVVHTPDGRFVAGGHATWTAPALAQSNLIEIITSAPAEPGPFEVTATLRGRTVARTLNAQ